MTDQNDARHAKEKACADDSGYLMQSRIEFVRPIQRGDVAIENVVAVVGDEALTIDGLAAESDQPGQVVDARRSRPAGVDEQRTDAGRAVGGREALDGQLDHAPVGLRVVEGHRHRAALRSRSAGVPVVDLVRRERRDRVRRWCRGGRARSRRRGLIGLGLVGRRRGAAGDEDQGDDRGHDAGPTSMHSFAPELAAPARSAGHTPC